MPGVVILKGGISLDIIYSEFVKELRDKLDLTQQELADALGIHRVTVARWETNAKRPSNLAKRQLARLVIKKGEII